uniref:Uncharacterized protein n=1 Tax=Arundo donax TaxID=35708 RepID=A0A0A9B4W5_ARUDO
MGTCFMLASKMHCFSVPSASGGSHGLVSRLCSCASQ